MDFAAEARHGLRLLYFAAALIVLALFSTPALARSTKSTGLTADNPRYAAIVVDANSGATLRQVHADSLRHPASLTKIMTLYLLFERLETGKLKLTTQLPVSVEAASQAPTKLGLKPGQTIAVEDAIKALITKSANDVAVVVAEAISGSEEEFARAMTRKARALGMARTVYRNASGLPDDDQVTTARDQARLGILIQERFPRYYRYFALTKFTYRGASMRNHNKLVGRVTGVDGIKTGYVRASGYNLVTSMRRGGRHVVAVVMGGDTAAQRDAHMLALLERHIIEASLKRPEVQVAQAPQPSERAEPRKSQRPEPHAEPRVEPRAEARAEAPAKPRIPRIVIVPVVAPPSDAAQSGETDPLNPTAVKTVPIRAATVPSPIPYLIPHVNAYAPESGSALEAIPLPSPAESQADSPDERAEPATGNIAMSPAPPAPPAAQDPAKRATRAGGWAVQVGAFEHEEEAKRRLIAARSKVADLLRSADPYTEKATRGDKTFYRARFAGLDRARAETVCKVLQRNDMACMPLRN